MEEENIILMHFTSGYKKSEELSKRRSFRKLSKRTYQPNTKLASMFSLKCFSRTAIEIAS